MIYNDEQWEVIKEAGPHFRTAKQDYIRNAPRYMTEQIVNAYEAATGMKTMSKDYGCAVCVLRIYQTVGKTYFQDLEEREKLEREKKNEQENGKPDTGSDREDKDEKKRTRKSKAGNKKKED